MFKYKVVPMGPRAAVHIITYNIDGKLNSDKYAEKLFWFETKSYSWPKCIRHYLFSDNLLYQEWVYLRCPPSKGAETSLDFFKEFRVDPKSGYHLRLQYVF